ncbi:MAG TPA: ComEC/Rec2 family competence protein, partial [Gillisia sp.]|nr:ComEC/Rec2 family competence protein [Gillisia sp.]
LFTFLGLLTVYTHIPENNPKHYINLDQPTKKDNSSLLIADVAEVLKPGLFQDRYILKLRLHDTINAEGSLLLNISRDQTLPRLKIGQRLAIKGNLEDIKGNLNPYQFDYSRYMKTLGVYKQLNLSSDQFEILPDSEISLFYYAGKLRAKIISKLKNQDFSPDELAVIQALLLGQRQELSSEIQQNYAAAGVIHILAVSGLHVGIILFMLHWLLQFLDNIKYGKTLKTIILLISLWGFALIAGLSPSVVRAVSMFSFVAIGMQLNKRTSILNTLFASLLILLLINPFYIYQVGFQLSYSAVFAIVVFQPYILRLADPKNKILAYFWKIASVTLAAQIGVLPLSLFYFHQFPGLFLVSNILILPFIGLILAIGISLILLILLGINPMGLSKVYGWMISCLNNFVAFIATKDAFVIKDISFSLYLCISFGILLISLSFLLKKPGFKNLAFVLSSLLLIQLGLIYEKYQRSEAEFVIFHRTRNTDIGLYQMGSFSYYSSNLEKKPTFITDYEIGKNIDSINASALKNVYTFAEKEILVIDSLGIYKVPEFNPKLVLLTNSPKINLERILRDLHPEQIIADGSNYKNLIERWRKTALNKKIPFHATAEKGAFILKSKNSPEN